MAADPHRLFETWFAEARASEPNDAEAMTLATASADGAPSARMVLLKGHDARGFAFYTNGESRKGGELAANPRAALVFHWKSLRRQVRAEGRIEPVPAEENDLYFATRSRDARIGAWASDQSRPLESRAAFEARYRKLVEEFEGREVGRPPYWSGYRLVADRIEFWVDRPHRLHERRLFTRTVDGSWAEGLLYPMTERARLTAGAALASVAAALFLLGLKSCAAWATGSVAMLGSLADTGLDLVASLVTLFAVRVAALPADSNHRFGHGKAEALAAMAQVVLISISAIGIGWRAAERLIAGDRTANAEYGIAVSIVALAVTLALVAYQRSVIRRTGSVAIRTDNVHYQSDLLLNLAVIAALVLDQYSGLTGADPLLGLAIAAWLLFGALRASAQALDQLMDKEWPHEKRLRFLAVASCRPEAKGIHDLRTRTSGAQDFAQFHIWVDPAMTVAEAHEVVEAIENDLALEFPGCEVLIHLDPEGRVDHPGNPLRETDETKEAIPE